MRVLYIESHCSAHDYYAAAFAAAGWSVDTAVSGNDGLALAGQRSYEVIMVNFSLCDMPGWKVVERLRQLHDNTPVALIAASASVPEVILAITVGAKDFILPPHHEPAVVVDKLRAVAGVAQVAITTPRLVMNLQLFSWRQTANYKGNEVRLSPQQTKMLELLLLCNGKTVGLRQMMEYMNTKSEMTVRSQLRSLRQKLRTVAGGQNLIDTIGGKGFRLTGVQLYQYQHKQLENS